MRYSPEIVDAYFRECGLPQPVMEFRFKTDRRWRFDFSWPEKKIALEVEGSVWTQGRHTRGSGFVKDMEKYNEAACLGWRVLRVVPNELCMQKTVDQLKRALNLE